MTIEERARTPTLVDERGDGIPPFRMLLPPGWVRYEADDEGEHALLDAMRAKLKPLGRPELDFELTAQLKASMRRLRTGGGLAMYLPTALPDERVAPISLTTSLLRDPDGRSLDQVVTSLVRDQGATFLGDDHAIIRRRQDVAPDPRGFGIPAVQLDYLTPVPGSSRRSALALTAVVLVLPDGDEPELTEILVEVADAIAGTFAWVPEPDARTAP